MTTVAVDELIPFIYQKIDARKWTAIDITNLGFSKQEVCQLYAEPRKLRFVKIIELLEALGYNFSSISTEEMSGHDQVSAEQSPKNYKDWQCINKS